MKNSKFWRVVIYSSLILHLIVSNAKIINDLNADTGYTGLVNFIFALLFAVSYSLATLYLLSNTNRIWLIVLFSVLDGFLIGLWYVNVINGDLFIVLGGGFYAIYTALIFIGIGLLNKVEKSSKNELSELTKSYDELLKSYSELVKNKDKNNKLLFGLLNGYAYYIKWRFNKSNNEESKNMAEKVFDLADKNFKFTEFTEENINEIIELWNGLSAE